MAAFIAESREEGLLEEGEGELLASALALSDQPVRAVTVPLADVVTLPVGVTYAEAEAACVRTGFSRFPLADDAGRLVGYVHLKDLLMVPDGMQDTAVAPGRVRPLAHIPADTPLDTALTALQARGAHLAVVRDGQEVLGVAMFEDVVERLVGEVADAAQAGTTDGATPRPEPGPHRAT